MFDHIKFANPEAFWLLLLIPAAIAWYWFRGSKSYPTFQISDLSIFPKRRRRLKEFLLYSTWAARIFAFALLIIAIARPQSTTSRQDVNVEGIDIIMALDISTSMLAEDFRPNRLEAAKEVAQDFIKGRLNDRIGLVVFAGESFTQCPLTTDHGVLLTLIDEIKSGMIEDGTAIGDGLGTAVNRLKESQAISKVIILLTDGENNRGFIDPLSAAEIAKVYGLRVYTIGVGTIGTAPHPIETPFGIQYQQVPVRIDEPLLRQIADMTDGKYFRATNKKKLQDIYSEIDKLEKSKIDVTEFRKKKEEFHPFAFGALTLLLIDILITLIVLRRFP
ncbi:MAG TPA: VWA domain-containing protein [Lentimicrobium sp.]|nr:VWA domain-containing protein [Lentimicrobium sp.]